ncbi:YicC/YloC family endoribonuclease [Hyphomicrobium sulfonivorans]|uniref:Protein YicC n=1 Tax=Hyphomicrobium sulfonivorans TaxID=121290 RepID=A0A125NUI7_HYPSL|nr:YicC/YloC family endoribonuclease [Hyphomicrobium sulfonivorans]KWT66734.1 Protein YicC [Hyphomicrobium sulfonivorans]MBI1650539.1 YicC family protein [Hyphomicrobium sulfonivorans]NSL72103.1 YicC family protein [Hyphomicrobium sulfonivorans]
MAIKSMTGFARAEGNVAGFAWHWELRTVNGRGLDVRLRLPSGLEQLEPKAREAIGRHLSRGSVTVNLATTSTGETHELHLNERALAQVMKAAERIRELTDAAPPRVDALIGIRGVLDVVEPEENEAETAARGEAMLATLDQALGALVGARAAEGGRLANALSGQIDEIERLVAIVRASPARTPEAIAARLKEQIARIMEAGTGFDPQRLHQEAVLLAAKADVEEELERLTSHISAARELLAENAPVGRKLDFLTQEFNREANTLCSKANDVEITRAGLALKSVIDQLREQVQNIE